MDLNYTRWFRICCNHNEWGHLFVLQTDLLRANGLRVYSFAIINAQCAIIKGTYDCEMAVLAANLGLALSPFPPADSPARTPNASEFAHDILSAVDWRKKDIPMCLACTALQQHDLRPGNIIALARPGLAVHYVGQCCLLNKSWCKHLAYSKREGKVPHL